MDNILAPIQEAFEGQIDFHGQHLADILSTFILILLGVVAFAVGYIQQDIYLTLWIGLGGTLLTALIAVPPWPIYKRNPEKWLDTVNNRKSGGGVPDIIVDGVKVG